MTAKSCWQPESLLSLGTLAILLALSAGCQSARRPATAPAPVAEEVQVGYGSQDRAQLTGNVESLEGVAVRERGVRRVEEMLEGRFPGVQVVRTSDGGFAVRIRGGGEPLYVIDGTPVRVAPGAGITWINPFDVARIDVLKGAAAAIYGERAAHGAVVITTRRGRG